MLQEVAILTFLDVQIANNPLDGESPEEKEFPAQ
jgi:hypothetical protein